MTGRRGATERCQSKQGSQGSSTAKRYRARAVRALFLSRVVVGRFVGGTSRKGALWFVRHRDHLATVVELRRAGLRSSILADEYLCYPVLTVHGVFAVHGVNTGTQQLQQPPDSRSWFHYRSRNTPANSARRVYNLWSVTTAPNESVRLPKKRLGDQRQPTRYGMGAANRVA